MANITAADVNKLRQMTGAGMMDCKKALQENDGDFDKAIDYLRKKGQKLATKRADKDANEGIVIARTNEAGNYGAIFMLNCETDFVAKNQEFVDFTNALMAKAMEKQPADIDVFKALDLNGRSVEENITEMVGKTGEKMELAHFETIQAESVYAYNHPGNRLATIVGFNKKGVENLDQAGHEVAMQIAAMAPVAVDQNGVSTDIINREMEIGKEQARLEGKPEEMIERIAQGKLNKFFKENTLLSQEFVRDNKLSVGEYLQKIDKGLTVTGFYRFMLGA
ncbi:MAG: translation elongation factor Ts [Lentimicrobium sp.]|jgi:elongation factor Ts|nr:translation elongation factor Ts [Lentimicrobiaceae bacterium]MDY0025965.1 translation elongation factor Ts [Lentimicrobium sp.]